ncbi:ceramide synthase 2-like [Haliotis asinina]|uniref:ceramide synthase 2-like n=1 Tax=Haliotis asinina TaxID=109174 RepID=UPI003532074A
MAAMIRVVENVLWSETFWFANGTSWRDLESTDPDIYYPKFSDMNISFFVGFLLLGMRYIYERFIVVPIAKSLGLKDRHVYLVPNQNLEAMYKHIKGKRLTKTDIEKAQKQNDMTEKQVQRWFFRRRLKDVPSNLFRFRDQSWQMLFYLSSFTYGMFTLWDKPWLWDTTNCWKGWPKQHVTNDVYYFYLVELGFYWCLLFTLFYDVKRKDFWEMATHHMITMLLLYFSWITNYVRVGTLVLVVHDASDHWMAGAKMAKYLKKQMLCEVLFFIFIVIWVYCRLYLYPFRILKTTYFEVHDYIAVGTCFWLFNFMLAALQVLHIVWTCFILRVIVIKVTKGSIERDIRSDTSDMDDIPCSSESDTDVSKSTPSKPVMNGVTTPRLIRNHDS